MSIISIPPLDAAAARAARERIDQLTKPAGSLGRIEELAERLAAVHGGLPPLYERRAILVGAGDHGVVTEGVSAYPSEVTPQMIGAFLGGFAAINAFARVAQAEVFVANFGVAGDLPPHERLLGVAVGRGTRNFAREAAMDAADVDRALQAGMDAFAAVVERVDPQLLALGEMGIGNTTSAAAVICAITGASPEDVVGRGTGLDDDGMRRKLGVVAAALSRLRSNDWRTVASEVGGYEIVGLAGALLAAASRRIPILLDGFIVASAALLAQAIAPVSIGYCIAAHRSREHGHAVALRHLGLVPLLDLDLRLGEGSGAALAMPLCDAASRMVREMKTFAQAGVSTATEPIQA
ncbi:MAG TPA: nicotinate-nucleotide--dimethylbenzimidazole phosphoribosyltransferase [Candidatus Acidoferrum sp.]|jgi:nicotinate-nucleotide--dimethylbenzimidazole phosphoribosyltransferase|nr:nicotinate-nucleotide--dimethylbenzimidazole phosphoribosyltransferase [Candidatus Acidoferrum sp.]